MTDHELRDRLAAMNLGPKRVGGQWQARCPCHDDRGPSLRATIAPSGKLLLHCFAGCPFTAIRGALGIGMQVSFTPVAYSVPERAAFPESAWWSIRGTDTPGTVEEKEKSLGLPVGGLRRVGAVWAAALAAIACPMLEAPHGQTIGVRLRADDGRKWAITGSRNGLFCPATFGGEGCLYLPEGLTDTAALVGLGLDAVGRPSCMGGREMLVKWLRGNKREIVVVSDRDEPGRRGADALAADLTKEHHRVKVLVPPSPWKDARAWVQGGATRETIAFAARHRALWSPA